MARVTNEVLLEMIKSVKEDTIELKNNNTSQWKEINKNSQSIAGMKGASGVIAVLVTAIMNAFILFFFKVQK